MLEGKPAFGYALALGSPLNAELLSNCGIDFLLLDRQHGSWGDDSTIAALTAMAAGSAVPMARVARNDYTLIGRLLDEGMMGIIVPMVHTPEDAHGRCTRLPLPAHRRPLMGMGSSANLWRRLFRVDRRSALCRRPD